MGRPPYGSRHAAKELNWGSSAIFPGDVWTEEKARKVDPNAYIYNLPGGIPEATGQGLNPKGHS